jgi:hypothetical protein
MMVCDHAKGCRRSMADGSMRMARAGGLMLMRDA